MRNRPREGWRILREESFSSVVARLSLSLLLLLRRSSSMLRRLVQISAACRVGVLRLLAGGGEGARTKSVPPLEKGRTDGSVDNRWTRN